MADQLSAFATAQDRNADTQRALLASIAESGSAGKQAYEAQQAQNATLQQAALTAAAKAPSAQLADTLALNTNALGGAQQSFEQDIARQQAANGNYMSQVGAAIPLVAERTRASVEQTLADLQAKREQQAADREQAQLALQGQRESLAGQREARAADAAARADAAKNGGLTPYQQYEVGTDKQDRADKATADAKAVADAKKADYLDQLNRSTAAKFDDKGNVSQSAQSYHAIYDVVNGYLSLDEALAKYKTPGGKPLSRQYVEDQINRINGLK